MSAAGFSKTPISFIPKSRRADSPPPVFTIRRLGRKELAEIKVKVFGDEVVEFDISGNKQAGSVKMALMAKNELYSYATVEAAVSGWKDVSDKGGNPIPFNAENVDCLDQDIIAELVAIACGDVSEEDEKNSVTPSSSASGSATA